MCAGVEQRLIHVGEQPTELEAPACRKRVCLEEVRDALAGPAGGVLRRAERQRIALDQRHPVAVAGEQQRGGEARDPTAQDRHRRGRHRATLGQRSSRAGPDQSGTAEKVSTHPINTRNGFGGGFIGDYTSLAVGSDNVFHAFWTDTNNKQTVVWFYGLQFVPTVLNQEDVVTASGSIP